MLAIGLPLNSVQCLGVEPAVDKGVIFFLATGGTIGGSQIDQSEPPYAAGTVLIRELLTQNPALSSKFPISHETICSIASQDIDETIWSQLAVRVTELCKDPSVRGIVVCHGTDTLEETAYFLQLTVRCDKPVVITGACRPSNALSADGPVNLYDSAAVAAHPESRGRGVLVVFNGLIHSARDVTKTCTASVNGFHSPNRGPSGRVRSGRVSYYWPASSSALTPFLLPRLPLPKVSILFAHAGMDPQLVDFLIEARVEGIVIAGVGEGNMPKPVIQAATQAVRHGIIVVRSSHVGSGAVLRNVEIDDEALAFITAGDLNPKKSRIFLQLALPECKTRARLQEYFDRC